MHKVLFILGYILFLGNSLIAQDTIFLDKSRIYYNNDYLHTKNRYSDELIKVTKDSFKIEECYYVFVKKPFRHEEKKRISNLVATYKIIGDSIIRISRDNYNEEWHFTKLSDTLYSVQRKNETGFASKLMPFTRHGKFDFYKNDEIQITRFYKKGVLTNYTFPKSYNYHDTVYMLPDLDVYPEYPGGQDALNEFIQNEYAYPYVSPESQIVGRIIIKYIVGKNGKIISASVLRGIDPFADSEALRSVYSIEGYKPCMIANKNVDVEMVVPTDFILK